MQTESSSRRQNGIANLKGPRPANAATLALAAICLCGTLSSFAQTPAYSTQIANQIVQQRREGADDTWGSPQPLLLHGMHAAWYNSANGAYFAYEKRALDTFLRGESAPGAISPQSTWETGLLGSELLLMHEVTRDRSYYDAATSLNTRLTSTCKAATDASPCMAEPFLAAYAAAFQHDSDLPVIAGEFRQWQAWLQARDRRTRDSTDEPSSTLSRARLLAALVDALPDFSHDEVDRQRLLKIFRTESEQSQSHDSHLNAHTQALSDADRADMISARLLRVYALLKGARLGFLPASAAVQAESEWKGLISQHLRPDAGNGALLLAATEMDLKHSAPLGHGQTVLLDAWFNSQRRQNAAGETEYFHYKWQDYSDSGYSLFGHIFRGYGVETRLLDSAPSHENLAKAQYYIIVSPDNPAKNPNPHYMTEQDADAVAGWVREGGVLVMLENDPPNADIAHLNLLADKSGIHFDDVLHHHIVNDKVRGDHIEDGTIPIAGGGPVFHDAHTIYMKDTCAISLRGAAQALLNDRGDVVMATARYGKGMVFAAVDPWAYNEYIDGRKNPAIYGQFDNFAAAGELVRWLVEQHNALAAMARGGAK